MNLNTLERIARQAIKGESVNGKSDAMLRSGFITPSEHRSLTSLSWQIAANMKISNGGAMVLQSKSSDDWAEGWWA